MKIRHDDTSHRALAALLLCSALLCGFLVMPCAAEPNDTKVELRLEGKFIERLVLSNKDEQTETFENPGQTIQVAPGKYRVKEVHLKGGYSFYYFPYPGYALIEADTNEPAPLKIGGPLRQVLEVQRQGGILVLNHRLLGIAEEQYRGTGAPPHPQFAAYKGDKKIKSAQFEYG